MSIPEHLKDKLEPEPARVPSEPAISRLSRQRMEKLEQRRLAEQNSSPPMPPGAGQTHSRYRGGSREITGLSARALQRAQERQGDDL